MQADCKIISGRLRGTENGAEDCRACKKLWDETGAERRILHIAGWRVWNPWSKWGGEKYAHEYYHREPSGRFRADFCGWKEYFCKRGKREVPEYAGVYAAVSCHL